MQTGSSGCQFSWLTIFLLVAVVLGNQQQNFVLNAASIVGITTTSAATKSNVSENVVVAAHKSTATPTKIKGTVKRQLQHIKQTMVDATAAAATTTKATIVATTGVHNGEIADETTATTTAVDTCVILSAQQQYSDAMKIATTTTEIPTIIATSSSVSVRDSTAFRTTPKAMANATKTTTTNDFNTTNMPTSSNANSHIAIGTATTQFQLPPANNRSSRHHATPPTTCGANVSSITPKIDCENMINKTESENGKVKCVHFCNSSKNNNNNNSEFTFVATIVSKRAKSDVTFVSYSKNNNSISYSNKNAVSYNNSNKSSHQTTCHVDCYDVR